MPDHHIRTAWGDLTCPKTCARVGPVWRAAVNRLNPYYQEIAQTKLTNAAKMAGIILEPTIAPLSAEKLFARLGRP